MTKIINWIIQNKDWIFSGVGVTVTATLILAVSKIFRRKKRSEPIPEVVQKTPAHASSQLSPPPSSRAATDPLDERIVYRDGKLIIPNEDELTLYSEQQAIVEVVERLRKGIPERPHGISSPIHNETIEKYHDAPKDKYISLFMFDEIGKDMSYSDVVEITMKEGEEKARTSDGSVRIYTWINPGGGGMVIAFKNDKFAHKAGRDLE